ncbi:M20/M25/M40 family metallo-hydrolase [Gordonia crocea]|uniref:Aminopeptidase n=1 Tax=Gordonia crocea TaxID=589162 RepID=A0A7M3SUJ2_9ACTN|nr:M20/M25/M40 family metallo-hydrolase [Gordonia crocea]GED96316.1 aminopeptidase [Gordonia crocea]
MTDTDAQAAITAADIRPVLGRAGGLVGIVVLLAVALLSIWDQRPPAPAPVDAPPTQFSAERALRLIDEIAVRPHPVATAEHARVRDRLVAELVTLGLAPTVHRSTGIPPASIDKLTGLVPVSRVDNIVAVINGTNPTGKLVLAAHYDSVPSGPGANDDGAGVAAVLEVVRALKQAGPPRNDVVVLLTDGEEIGLLGAEAYVRDHPLGAGRAVVLNHEARGSSGPTVMFRTSPGAAALTGLYADVVPHPAADSTNAAAFRVLPNLTDFTAFEDGGFAGLDSAYVRGSAYYHSRADMPANVGRGSLQQMGENSLAVARVLAGADLVRYSPARDEARGPDTVYFRIPPRTLIHVDARWAWVLLVVAVVLALGVIGLSRIRGMTTWWTVVVAAGAVALLLVATVIAGLAYWWVLTRIRPEFAVLPTATPWNPFWLQLGAVAVAGVVTAFWYPVVRHFGVWTLWCGALVVLTLVGVAAVAVWPQMAPVLVPAPFAALGGLGAVALGTPMRRAAALTVGLVPTAVLLAAVGWGTFDLGLSLGMVVALPLIMLSVVLALPLLALPFRTQTLPATGLKRPWLPSIRFGAPTAVAVIAATVLGIAVNAPGAGHMTPTRLSYVLNADTGRAQWVVPVGGDAPRSVDSWAAGYVGTEEVPIPVPDPAGSSARVGPARAVDLAAPTLRVVGDSTSGTVRTVRVAVASPRGAEGMILAVDDADGRVKRMVAAGREVVPKPGHGIVGVHLFAMPGPVEVELAFTAGAPLRVRLADVDRLPDALAELPGFSPPPDRYYLGHSRRTVVIDRRL